MKRVVFVLIAAVLLSTGCMKNDNGCSYTQSTTVAPASEQAVIEEYLTANNITATKHSSGMYYEIVQVGTGGSPGLCSQVQVTYAGKLTNGNTFDSNTNAVFNLYTLIDGWKKGIPMIQKNGRIKLYIPPSLGYGGTDIKDRDNNVIIPANSMLIFDITLLNFQ